MRFLGLYRTVSQILGNPLDHSLFLALSWLVVRIHWAGFGVWIAETWTAALYSLGVWPIAGPVSKRHLENASCASWVLSPYTGSLPDMCSPVLTSVPEAARL